MTLSALQDMMRLLARQLTMIRIVRYGVLGLLLAGFLGASFTTQEWARQTTVLVSVAALVAWVILLIGTTRLTREVQTGSLLLSTGQLDEAEVWLKRAIERFSLSIQGKIYACMELASLFVRQERYVEVAAVCRTVLRQPLKRLRHVFVSARLMLADSLLELNQLNEAYEAIRPVYDEELSLHDRMRLLPIELRYALAVDRPDTAVESLEEKVRIAELLDSRQAALVHALLAEACRRRNLSDKQAFFTKRAKLYHDLEPLSKRFSVITPLLEGTTGASENT